LHLTIDVSIPLASAELDYIHSVVAHNVAKFSLARAMGRAGEAEVNGQNVGTSSW
jgi:hypothetical protein